MKIFRPWIWQPETFDFHVEPSIISLRSSLQKPATELDCTKINKGIYVWDIVRWVGKGRKVMGWRIQDHDLFGFDGEKQVYRGWVAVSSVSTKIRKSVRRTCRMRDS